VRVSDQSRRTDKSWTVEHGVVEDDVDKRVWVDFIDVEQFSNQVSASVGCFSFFGVAVLGYIAFDTSADRKFRSDLDPDPEGGVPRLV